MCGYMSIKIQKCVGKVLLTNDLHAVCKMERFLKWIGQGNAEKLIDWGRGRGHGFLLIMDEKCSLQAYT